MGEAIGPGDLVECVDAGPLRAFGIPVRPSGLTAGRIYTVRAVGVVPAGFDIAGEPLLWLMGLVRPDADDLGHERGYRASRFRPVGRPATSFIERMKQPAPARDLEDA